jgi:7-cyano-7-deazaguanine synthase in queuosine biosynthesis
MYNQYDVMPLFDLTRSCEAVPDEDAAFDPEFEKNPCGRCWWCLERKWAFGRW